MSAAKSLTTLEIEQVLHYISTNANAIRNRAMFLMSVLAGLRVSELAGLTLSDIRNTNGSVKSEIFLAAHRVKHNHARTIYISSRLKTELEHYINSRVWIDEAHPFFSIHYSPRKPFSANTLTQHFFWLYRNAGVSASSHSGRKTFLTSLASQGISVFVLASLAGHKSITTTQRYITVNEDMKRKAVELV